jgi:hypothetical protein
MSNEELVRLRPRDLAAVWGKAFGQVAELWRVWAFSLLEVGAAEDPNLVGDHRAEVRARTVGGRTPLLSARDFVGETFGERLDVRLVRFAPKPSTDAGVAVFDCYVDESTGRRIRGDLYVGDVVDERGALVQRIALDAGS